jgi:NifU-like protein involved in Fe-S cluster formation/metal-sulfur cluster biosynthetic enzyme
MSETLARRFGYSQKVMDHFKNPRNIGVIEDADATAKVGSVACGDLIKLYLKFDHDQIKDIRFESYGCAANIATSSMMTEMVKGKTIAEARNVTFKDIAEELGGLPRIKLHCAVLSRQGLEAAFLKYEAKIGRVKIDESFVNKVLRGVLDPVEGVDIISAKIVESVAVEEGKRVLIALSAKPGSELAKNLTDDIHEAFEGLDIELKLKFKD